MMKMVLTKMISSQWWNEVGCSLICFIGFMKIDILMTIWISFIEMETILCDFVIMYAYATMFCYMIIGTDLGFGLHRIEFIIGTDLGFWIIYEKVDHNLNLILITLIWCLLMIYFAVILCIWPKNFPIHLVLMLCESTPF
jgi:hypothetical protein